MTAVPGTFRQQPPTPFLICHWPPPHPPPVANPLHLPQSTRQGVFLLLKFASVVDRPVPRLVVIEGPLCRERSSARLISCCGRMTVAGYVCIG